jgi:hypothetical protein
MPIAPFFLVIDCQIERFNDKAVRRIAPFGDVDERRGPLLSAQDDAALTRNVSSYCAIGFGENTGKRCRIAYSLFNRALLCQGR